jgi:glycosyltransferase involved in cell wall biosynthesis
VNKISIITVTFNDYYGLQKTIKSILSQTYINYEFIIIDGGSTDKTRSFLENIEFHNLKYISEVDTGPYDAMNKGIHIATGDKIIFLNSGDLLYNNNSLNLINDIDIDNNIDVILGGAIFDIIRNKIIKASINNRYSFLKNKFFCHQSIIYKSTTLYKYRFNLKYKIASDYEQLLRLYKNKFVFYNTNYIFSNYNTDGKSSIKYFELENEKLHILLNEDKLLFILYLINYIPRIFKKIIYNQLIKKVQR